MNKSRKVQEEKEARMSPEEKQDLQKQSQLESLAREIHFELFPEEYDFMMDSIADAKMRRSGKNPMSNEYINKVNARRAQRGVPPLGPDGMPTCKTSWRIAEAEAQKRYS